MPDAIRFITAQPRRRPGRAAALLAAILVATTGFTVLTGATATARLEVIGTVAANARSAYDILVRPRGARSALEQQSGLLRANYLAGQFGGITLAQYRQVQQVPGLAVAAPLAMVGYTRVEVPETVDVTDLIDPAATDQVLRLTPSWLVDRGLTALADTPQYVYLTRRPVDWSVSPAGRGVCVATARETMPDGRQSDLCGGVQLDWVDGLTDRERTRLQIFQALPDGTFTNGVQNRGRRLTVQLRWPVAVLVAAIDPAAEASLVGLDHALVSGRYLSTVDVPTPDPTYGVDIPLLAANRSYVDETVTVQSERLDPASAAAVPATPSTELLDVLHDAAVQARQKAVTLGGDALVTGLGTESNINLNLLIQAGPPTWARSADGTLVPATVPAQPQAFAPERLEEFGQTPIAVTDPGFRVLSRVPSGGDGLPALYGNPVGIFDPGKLRGFGSLSAPLESYQAPAAAGADDRSRALLHDQPLAPSGSPAGYLATPPLLFTTLSALPALYQAAPAKAAAPLSTIRVRVAGVTGVDPESRERVRRVAEEIATGTGLDTDITLGSSPQPQTIDLPAGTHGRPALRLAELWTRKGVAALIITAIDRESLILFGLILLVCALFLANGVSAAVRDRRRDLALLVCLGWPRWRLAGLIVGEVAGIATVAGLLAAFLAVPLGRITGVGVSVPRALLAVPAAILLSVVAAAVPALRAARVDPVAAMTPMPVAARRLRLGHRRSVAGLALAGLARVPGRNALGAAAVAIGAAGVTVLTSVVWAFHSAVTGTLLGDAVSVRVRGVDAVAIGATVLLGMLAIGDVLYLNVRERAAELATLRATGWPAGALSRLVATEGAAIGLIGGLAGAAVGLAMVTWFAGGFAARAGLVAGLASVAGCALATLSALVPAQLTRRLPMARLLAED